MSSPNRPARLNRTVLAILGTTLLVAGTFGLTGGLGLLVTALPAALPAGFPRGVVPVANPDAPVVPAGTTLQPWAPYAIAAAAVMLMLLCLRWLLAQVLRRPPASMWRLPTTTGHGSTRIDATHAADAVAADITGYPGVATASATLTGTHGQPRLMLDVSTTTDTSVTDTRHRISTHALPRLRTALDLDQLDDVSTELLVRIDTAPAHRIHDPILTRSGATGGPGLIRQKTRRWA